MAGRPYEAGGIRSTVAATRAASDDVLRSGLARHLDEAARQGTTTVEVKSGYGLTVADEERSVRLAREATPEVTFLGAHVVPVEYAGRADAYLDLVCGRCSPRARRTPGGSTCSARPARSRPSSRAASSRQGPPPGSACACTRTSSGRGGCASPSGWAPPRWTTARTSPTTTSRRSRARGPAAGPGRAAPRHRRDPAPGRRVLHAPALPRRATAARRGRRRRARERLQPRVELHVVDAAVRRARRPRDADDRRRGRVVRDRGRCARAAADDVGHLAPGARADVVLLDAPSRTHLAYRPGVPLVSAVWKDAVRLPPR